MMRALYTAASGMTAQELNLDNIANNLSNSSTAGFRSRRLQFEDLIYQNLIMPGAAATQQTTVVAGLQVGLGTRSAASEVIQTQGDFSQTGNPLDLTIQGQGFFQVLLPDGQTAYTRAGSFHLDGQGNLVSQDGDPVQPAIAIPTGATSVTVGSDGTVSPQPWSAWMIPIPAANWHMIHFARRWPDARTIDGKKGSDCKSERDPEK